MKKIITFTLILSLLIGSSGCFGKSSDEDINKPENATEATTEFATEKATEATTSQATEEATAEATEKPTQNKKEDATTAPSGFSVEESKNNSNQENSNTSNQEQSSQSSTENSNNINYNEIYNEYIKTNLVPTHGFLGILATEGLPLHETPEYANPGCWCREDGIISIKIADLNNDSIPELIVPYAKKTQVDFQSKPELNGDDYSSLWLKIYTYNGGAVQELLDVRLTEVIDYKFQDFKMFISENEGKKYLCFYQNITNVEVGFDTKILFMYLDNANQPKYDVIFAPHPFKDSKYILHKGSSYDLKAYNYNSTASDYCIIEKNCNPDTYHQDENEYWGLYSNELSQYGLSLGLKGETVYKHIKQLILGENIDNIFYIQSSFDTIEKATITDYTCATDIYAP